MSKQQKPLKDFTPEERTAAEAQLEKLYNENGRVVFERLMHSEEEIARGEYVMLDEAFAWLSREGGTSAKP